MGETTPPLRGKNERRHPHEKEQSTAPKNPQLPALHYFIHHRRKGGDRVSTNKTPNLNLHAWEPTDAFSRAEINDNFAAIDTTWADLTDAVGGKAEKWELFDTYSFSAHFPIFLTIPQYFHVDWSKWEYVMILCDMKSTDPGDNDTLRCRLAPEYETIFNIKAGQAILFFAPRHDPSRKISGLVVGSELAFFSAQTKYQDLSLIELEQIGAHNLYQTIGGTIRYYGRI